MRPVRRASPPRAGMTPSATLSESLKIVARTERVPARGIVELEVKLPLDRACRQAGDDMPVEEQEDD
jgi:hypothetical protein